MNSTNVRRLGILCTLAVLVAACSDGASPSPAAEREEGIAAPGQPDSSPGRKVVLHVTGMMKSKGGAT